MCFKHANNIINPCIYVGNDKAQVVNEEKYLGNTLFSDIAKRDMTGTVRDWYMGTNILLSDFTHTDSVTLSQLFNTYCMNVYGSQLWDYGASYTSTFYVAWRKCIRRLWKLPLTTHCNFIPLINNNLDVRSLLEKQFSEFLWMINN